jgi:hypothetical protein
MTPTLDDGIITEIAALERDLNEFKGRQFAGGDNIRVKLTETGNTWDVDTTIPPTAGLTWWEVVFIPDDGRPGFAQLGFDYLVTPDSGFELLTSYPSPIPGPANQIKYIVEYSNPNTSDVNVKLKFTMRSFSSGTLSWSIVRQEP